MPRHTRVPLSARDQRVERNFLRILIPLMAVQVLVQSYVPMESAPLAVIAANTAPFAALAGYLAWLVFSKPSKASSEALDG